MNTIFGDGRIRCVLNLLRLFAVLLVAVGVFFRLSFLTYFGVVCLVVFCVYCFVLSSKLPHLASKLGDDVYFLGYMVTIVGIAGIAFSIVQNPYLIQTPTGLIEDGMKSISSTLIGLLARSLITEMATSYAFSSDLAEEKADRLESTLAKFVEKLENANKSFVSDLNEKIMDLKGFNDEIGRSREGLVTFKSDILSVATEVRSFSKTTNSLSASVIGVTNALDASSDAFGIIGARSNDLSGLIESLVACKNELGHLHSKLQNGKNESDAFKASLSELSQVVDQFVEVTSVKIQNLDQGSRYES